jgi:broad specificity phosphatase PhoE
MISRTSFSLRAAVGALCLVVVYPAISRGPEAQGRGTLQVYLARHGQTDGNLNRIAQGWTDTALNETGRQHAAMLADRLKGVPLDAIYSSTLSRSRETAQAVATAAGVTVRSLPGLREIGLGRFENVALDDPLMKTRPPADKRGPEDGESGAQVEARVGDAIAGIRKAHASGTILIVGHAGANAYVMRALLGLTPEEMAKMGRYVQDNDELYMLEFSPGAPPRVFKFIPAGKFTEL